MKSNIICNILILLTVFIIENIPAGAADNVLITANLDLHPSRISIEPLPLNRTRIHVDMEAISIADDRGWNSDYKTVRLPDGEKLIAGQLSEIGYPEVPSLTTMIAIPDMAGITVSADYSNFEIIDDINLLPAQAPQVESGSAEPQPFSIDISAYERNRFYPEIIAEAGAPLIMRDVRLAQIVIYPVHYNPVTRQLKIYRNVSIDISYDGQTINPKTGRHDFLSEAFYPIYKSFISNFDDYMNTLTTTEIRRGGILIITPDIGAFEWAEEISVIANWKRQKGYEVTIVTTSEIRPSGTPHAGQICDFLIDAYNTWEIPPEYVYLIGDEDITHNGARLLPDYPYNYYHSDHPYSMLEGQDYHPDLIVCRVSVDNINDLRCWIAKTLIYEKYPDISEDPEYWRRAIMVAGCQQTVTCPWTVLWAKEKLEQRGFVHIDTVFDRGSDPPDAFITNPITAGVGYVNYRGWAGSSGWYDPSYNTGALNTCQNINKPGIMTSIVCGTGDFGDSYSDPCFGEMWIRMGSETAPRGGPCMYGTTDHGAHTRWNQAISLGFYGSFLNHDIYHFGATMVASKLHQFRCFPRAYDTIQKYFHTYNIMGDPELEMRLTTPITQDVTHPAIIERGVNNIELRAIDEFGEPLEGAYVTLIMGDLANESFFAVTKTDAAGYAILDVPTDTAGELTLTITGRELYPYISPIIIGQSDETIALGEHYLDDDIQGYSYGNNDGQANPGETIELTIDLQNFGNSSTAEGVTAQLLSSDETIATVNRSIVNYGQIAPGQISSGDGVFVITVEPSACDGDGAGFMLNVSSENNPDGWVSSIIIPVLAAKFAVNDIEISGNGQLDPDETVELIIELTNIGQLDAENVTGDLQSEDGYIHIVPVTGNFGSIGIDEAGQNSGSPISVAVDPGIFIGKNIPFILNLTHSGNVGTQTNFNLTVGQITESDPSGPDTYGYYMFDDLDINYSEYPIYEWAEIRSLPEAVNLQMTDDVNVWYEMPFDFTYYGESYDHITICSNGWVSMDSAQWPGFRNWPLPDPAYGKGMIAGFWDDLGPYGNLNIYTYNDLENHRLIIEWYQVLARWNQSIRETFQIILYDPDYHPSISGDAIIELVYNDIYNGDGDEYWSENYCSVGWEDITETKGFNISYCDFMSPGCAELGNGRVYRITTNTGRGAIAGNVLINVGEDSDVLVRTSTGQWDLSSTDGAYSIADVPPGTPDITFSKPGWFPLTLENIQISANEFTLDQNAALNICPMPTNLTASEGLQDHINIQWAEVNHPDIAGYNLYRSRWENGIYTKINDTPILEGSFNDYSTVDDNIYWYYTTTIYAGADYQAVSLGSNKDYGSNVDITEIDEISNIPDKFALMQNYPNPFNQSTTIRYDLPKAGDVTIDIYDILGRKVETLINGNQPAGHHQVTWNARDMATGMYFYKLNADNFSETKKMIMLK
ncbi:MAG: T9SS type A sorting domain-containing protein [candidate division Zixibacteria bacterium]|nr:T9SS type A sorting domain-containing protein [candidate division Zixibacteria bacterium]